MFNIKLSKTILALSLIFSCAVSAQDFVPADSGTIDQVAVVDSATAAINESVKAPYTQEQPTDFVSAEDQLNEYLSSKNWREGWDDKKKRMFVVYSESFDVEDPSYDTDFIAKRSLFSTMASMGAKAKVIEFMRTEMSATDQMTAPGTDVHEALNAKYNKLQNKIAKQQEKMVKLLSQVDEAEAKKLEGVTWGQLSKTAMSAIIKKLDDSFDQGLIEEKNRKSYDKALERYQSASGDLDSLQQQAQAIAGEVKLESNSKVSALAKAPLLGATILAQAESWDAEEEEYQLAVLVVWSEKLEKAAQNILLGKVVKTKSKKGRTINEWSKTQDLSTMVGSRQFRDKDGVRWFIGAYGTLLEGSSSAKRKAKGIADIMARKEVAVSLFADLETHKQATIAMQTRGTELGGKDSTTVASSFAEKTRQSIENRQISGMSKLLSRKVKHPVSGQNLYVVLYAISSDSAVSALQAEARNYSNAVIATRVNEGRRQVKAKNEANLKAAESQPLVISSNVPAKSVEVNTVKKSTKPASKKQQSSGKATVSTSVFAAPELDDDDF
ncbi:hypothetical protein [Pelagibaculum spongiae]|uniref:Uncharacterized protein n=1 Tax=Pelagibaculum spongiae TaxID=2080658 RepID=A0A2V1GYC5_9GAMM|nr:hypothetical protein [Pelagibaculum spongiae]PVZ70653.1 hypothetical protein DC094_08745 [Pelagibaculum spongiae]